MRTSLCYLIAAIFCGVGHAAIFAAPTEVSNFALIDQRGKLHELRRMNANAVILFFTANGCPVARQNASKLNALRERFGLRGVEVVMVNSSSGDDRASIVKEMRELRLPFMP